LRRADNLFGGDLGQPVGESRLRVTDWDNLPAVPTGGGSALVVLVYISMTSPTSTLPP
jgi:hypothetical protein